jgi:hypothetical protein
VVAQRGRPRGDTGPDPRLHAGDEVERHVKCCSRPQQPWLTRNSPGHAVCAAPVPPHVRHECLAQLCALVLQGRVRRQWPVSRRRPRHGAASDGAIGTSEPACTPHCRNTDARQTLCSILKWCWSRLPGGVVTWDVYELFRIGEAGESRGRMHVHCDRGLTAIQIQTSHDMPLTPSYPSVSTPTLASASYLTSSTSCLP